MQCNQNNTDELLLPKLQMLEEISKTITRYNDQSSKIERELWKIVMRELVFNHVQLSAVDIEAKAIEASTCISRFESILASYKADIDRFSVDVMIGITCASGAREEFAREWVPKRVARVVENYEYFRNALDNIKGVLTMGKADWSVIRQEMIVRHGIEVLTQDL